MDETGSLKGVGSGFLNQAGQLKSKEQLAADDRSVKARANGQATDYASTVTNAFGAVRSQTSAEINRGVSALNVNDDNIKKAQELVSKQVKTAKELKQAIKQEDSDTIEAKQNELAKLQDERNKLAKKIEEDNRAQQESEPIVIKVGNDQKGAVDIKPVNFDSTKVDSTELDQPKEVEQLISDLKDDQASLKTQKQDQKDTRQEIKAAADEADKTISKFQSDAIRSFDEATKAASKIADDIRSGSQQAISNLSVSAVQRLLSA